MSNLLNNLYALQKARQRGTVAVLCMVCALFFTAAGCKNQKDTSDPDPPEEEECTCEDDPIITVIKDFSEHSIVRNFGYMARTIHLINDSRDMKESFSDWVYSNYPELDFSKHSLLFVWNGSTSPITDISTGLQQLSSNYVLHVDVTILKNAKYYQNWYGAFITNKICDIDNIELVITTFEDEAEPQWLEVEPGTYVESYPRKGNTKIEFIDHERLVYTKYINLPEITASSIVVYYQIDGYWLCFLKSGIDSAISSRYYFRIINPRMFEFSYDLYFVPETPPYPTMIFEKE